MIENRVSAGTVVETWIYQKIVKNFDPSDI